MRNGRPTLLARSAAIALLLLAVPAASSAAQFVGSAKVTWICQGGAEAETATITISLTMEPGAGAGVITTSAGAFAFITDWITAGKRSYFAASISDSAGAYMYYGTITGTKLKGYFSEHYYNTNCVFTGKLKAAQAP